MLSRNRRFFESKINLLYLGYAIIDVFAEVFEQTVYYSENYCNFQRFLLFRNKARNARRSRKNAGMREVSHCGMVDFCLTHLHTRANKIVTPPTL